MVLARWQATIVDESGDVQDGATVEVRRETTGSPLALLYSDRDGLVPLANPFSVGADGFAAFHVDGDVYKITATKNAFSRIWRYVGIGTAQEHDWDFSIVTDAGYIDFVEIADPGAPNVDHIRAFAYDVGGISTLALRDSNGFIFQISATGGFFNAASKLDFGSGDVTITHSTDALAFAGASSGYSFDADLKVTSNTPSLWLEETNSSPTEGLRLILDGGILQFQRRNAGFGALTGVIVSFDMDAPASSLTIDGSGNVGLGVDLAVSEGGSGRSTATAYAVICGGIAAGAAHQSIADVGTAGNVLTSNGPGALPTFQASAAAAGLVLLTAGTVSASATLDLVLTAYTAYRGLIFELSGFLPATDGVDLFMRFSTDGGSTYDAGAGSYNWAARREGDSAAGANAGSGSDTEIQIVGVSEIGNASTEGINLSLKILNQTSAAFWTRAVWQGSFMSNAAPASGNEIHGQGAREAAQDTDAVRFLFSSGNISAGKYAIYGLL